jgi:hypothetical protein
MKSLINLSLIMLLVCIGISQAQDIKDPKATEVWSPTPTVVTPGEGTNPPSDAIVLFDGKNLDQWVSKDGQPAKWIVKDGVFTVAKKTGDIRTKQSFGDVQLHIEWRVPADVVGEGQDRGNSGVLLQSQYEVQVLDSYKNETYVNGQAAAVYKQHIPLVNACRKPGEWQTYDIIYKAPVFKTDGSLESPARVTVLHNGVLVQNNVEIKGPSSYIGRKPYKAHGKAPLQLQDHNHAVSYRNIWIREL